MPVELLEAVRVGGGYVPLCEVEEVALEGRLLAAPKLPFSGGEGWLTKVDGGGSTVELDVRLRL
jgi:hypothetical protein